MHRHSYKIFSVPQVLRHKASTKINNITTPMKRMVKSSRLFKSLLLAGLLVGPTLAFNAMAVPETDYHWSPFNVINDGNGPYAYAGDPGNWDSAFVPTVTNTAGAFIRTMVNQATGSHVVCIITNNTDLYQLMIGTDPAGGGDVVITNGAQVTAGMGLDGGPTQWTGLGFPGGPSSLYIGPGCSLSCGDHLWIGNGNINSTGTLIVDGGALHVQGQFGLGWNGFAGTTNYATIKNGGHIFMNQWGGGTLGQGGSIGILNIADNSSLVTINGNVTGNFAALTNSSQLIAYGGAGTIGWSYNPGNNTTTIIAVAPVNPNTPIFSTQPANTIVGSGAPATLHALVSNVPANYGWLLNNAPLTDGGGISGSHTANLSIASVTSANVGNYICVATNQNVATEFTLSSTASLTTDAFGINPVVTINGVIGDTYVCQYTSSLTPPVTWTPFATNTLGTAIQYVIDLNASLGTQRFYRVVQP